MTPSIPMLQRGYVICGSARTGSSLLAEALRSTGALGYPQEYFNVPAMARESEPPYPVVPEDQAAEIARRGTTDNGVYGLKLFYDQLAALNGFDWAGALPGLHFIYLERRDLLGQAISWVRAMQSVQWNSGQSVRGDAVYDSDAITAALHRFADQRAGWAVYFARNGLIPHQLVYEDMVGALPQAVATIGTLVGVDAPSLGRVPTMRLDVQRDALNDAWRERFVATHRNLALIDHLSGDRPASRSWRLFGRSG